MATEDDLAETVREVEQRRRRIVAARADVRDAAGLDEAVSRAVSEAGGLDIISINAGICSFGAVLELHGHDPEQRLREALDAGARASDASGRRAPDSIYREINAIPVPWVDSIDISNAVLFLA
jgi:NAD(P)-dependent dehydrogenase (short-subunit alcohol dehydrogenase family)